MSRPAVPKANTEALLREGTPVSATADVLLEVPLYRLAHGRTGDKGDRSNISVIAWHPEFWPLLVHQLTPEAVARQFRDRAPGRVQRFLLPRLAAMNFVLDEVLDGGVNDALNLDAHGKSLSFLLLDMKLRVPHELRPLLAGADNE